MSARELLTQLLDYIEEQAKNVNPRAYRLASSKAFLKRRADLAGLPGVEFNLRTEGDHLWLRVQRLHAAPPPDLDGSVRGLVRITSDPSGPAPSIDEAAFSLRVVEIATGAPPEERAELESQERLRVDQRLATYSALWRAWAERGYRVIPQVQSGAYRIDMVVEGVGDLRLAVECDGDEFHGPDRWSHDMTRQRVLERAGGRSGVASRQRGSCTGKKSSASSLNA